MCKSRIHDRQPATNSNPNRNPNPDPTAKQQVIVNIQLNMVTCPTYPDTFKRGLLLLRLCDLSHSREPTGPRRRNVTF